jgi:hypothetical protein
MLVVCCVFLTPTTMTIAAGNTAQALYQLQRVVASHEAAVTLHRVMLIPLYRPSGMVIKIAVKLVTFVYIVDNSAARKKKFSLIIMISLNHFGHALVQPLVRVRPGLGKTKKNLPRLRGGNLPWWGCLCCVLCFDLYDNHYVENLWGGSFLLPPKPE